MGRTYQYSPTLRVLGLFGSMLAGGILLGSVLAEIEAADAPDLILHGIGVVVGAAILWLGVEFGTRRITPTPDALSTRLLRARWIGWDGIRDVRDGPFGALIIRLKRGLPIVVWPFMEGFDTMIAAIDAARVQKVSHA